LARYSAKRLETLSKRIDKNERRGNIGRGQTYMVMEPEEGVVVIKKEPHDMKLWTAVPNWRWQR
jgi:hypothetical protein